MQNNGLSIPAAIEINPPHSQQEALPKQRQPGKPFLCRHIFVDGRRCGSFALRHQHFCYYHYAHRTPVLANQRRRQPKSGFDLTRLDGLDNHTAIQLSLSEVLSRIAENTIDPKRAGLLLYGLQIASQNVRRTRPNEDPLPEAIVEDDAHGQLADLEDGRIVPGSTLEQMRTVLQQRIAVGPTFKAPEGFEELVAGFNHLNDSQTPESPTSQIPVQP